MYREVKSERRDAQNGGVAGFSCLLVRNVNDSGEGPGVISSEKWIKVAGKEVT